jgi:hypothetical protein
MFDIYPMNFNELYNLGTYLLGNSNLPYFEHICHADSKYVDAVQFTSQLVTAAKEIIFKTDDEDIKDALDFILFKDITYQK